MNNSNDHVLDVSFSTSLRENKDMIQYFMGPSSDFCMRELQLPKQSQAILYYLDGMINKQDLQQYVITPLLEQSDETKITSASIKHSILNVTEVVYESSIMQSMDHIITGSALLVIDDISEGILIPLPGWEDRSVTDSQTQSAVRGPQNAFTESIAINRTLVRRITKDTRLRVNTIKVGKLTKTDVSLMYIQHLADEKLVQQLTEQLQQLTIDRVLEGQYIEELLTQKKQWTFFPTCYNSDRPDTIAAGILDGKVAIFIDGTPFVLLAPAFFTDFLHAAEDNYQPFIYSNAIRLLRYLAMIICILAPSIYISLTTFHQDMLPTQLLLSLAAQREGVPFPAFLEALLMEVAFEILREAGIRMPRTIGQAVSIVGTIVIGQAAVEAGMVSAVMVIVVAITAISSFVIPSYTLSLALRLVRFGFMGLAAMFGFYGLTIGMLILIIHLTSLQTFGFPYTAPVAPYLKRQQSDALLRLPYHNKTKKEPK
ncbi:spore germination protein [Paenibacillus yanchengensis]|uniref:Spore germination protein n=1 Tax=Paenibacillus yanchengensis TaxID=2035833 RepID=A0ABW4YQV1_9BACL